MWESHVHLYSNIKPVRVRVSVQEKSPLQNSKLSLFIVVGVMAGWTRFFAVFFEFFGGWGGGEYERCGVANKNLLINISVS